MSIREPTAGLPAEATLIEGQLPRPGDTPSVSVPTPGLALAIGRVPMAPTLPDPLDALGAMMARVASDLLNAPPAGPEAAPLPAPGIASPSGAPAIPSLPALPAAALPTAALPTAALPAAALPAAPTTLPGVAFAAPATQPPSLSSHAGVPFSAGLDGAVLDALANRAFAPTLGLETFSLVPQTPALPSTPESASPYWLAPQPRSTPTATHAPVSYEIAPVTDLAIRPSAGTIFDPHAIRREFPILGERVHGKPLVWLDNAATTQKPRVVIDRVSHYYEHENSNIHRAAHTLAARATDAYESARESTRRFLNAPSKNEIVFVRGATEGINLVAQSWGRRNVHAGDEIVLSWLEHHANIVPWQRLCAEVGATLKVAPVDEDGQVILEAYERLLGPRTRLVAFTQVSNALGTITPAHEMIALAHRHGAHVLLDGAQAVSHMPVDVQSLDCDFYVFSGHKVFAPTGIGVVYGKPSVLEAMPPWQGGGNMIQDVTFERTTYQGPPARFEAGTGNIADAVGLGAALDWLSRIGLPNVERYEHELLVYATERLRTVPGLRMIGTAPHKAGVLSFVLAGQKTEEVGGMLDQEGIAVRSGHHCAQPILRRFGLEATVRASLAPYNTCEDIDALVAALKRIQAGRG